MPSERIESALHGSFYRNGFRKLLTVIFVITGINFCLLAYAFYQLYTRQPSTYFATTTEGRLISLTPVR